MWLDTPATLRRQILDDFRQHRTPTGAVTETARRRKAKTLSERRDATEAETLVASAREA
jgi:hypothetical protein